MQKHLLIINPGSTSTKLAYYTDGQCQVQENLSHDPAQLHQYPEITDQIPLRLEIIHDFLRRNHIDPAQLSAVVGRGGLTPGMRTGGYLVDEALAYALRHLSSPHASNLGGLLAREIADPLRIPAYIYDAVTAGELPEVARITGIPAIERQSFCHVLNSRAMAIRYAQQQGKRYDELRLIVAHLGGGISASAHEYGKIIDSAGDDDGAFSPERAGGVPLLRVLDLCYSGQYSKAEMRSMIRGKGGMYAHLGTSSCLEIERRIQEGDTYADTVFQAQAYQIAKAVGLLSIALKGQVDTIILTGGLANSVMLTDRVKEYVNYIAPVTVMPGELEMEALALGGLRLLRGQEEARTYRLPAKEE